MEKEIEHNHQIYLGEGGKSSAANTDWLEFQVRLLSKEIAFMCNQSSFHSHSRLLNENYNYLVTAIP